MVYSSYVFILVFLPIVLIIYYLLSKSKNEHPQKIFLVASSLFFYGYFNWSYLIIIISSIIVNFIIANLIKIKSRKIFLIAGVVYNVFLLGYFKYFDFFIGTINAVFKCSFALRNIFLPLGISFFTFQQISFLISVYKKEEDVDSLLDYAVFVTFFPQLVAGPIVQYKEMIPQFKDSSKRYFSLHNFCQGLYLFSIGALKKVVIADSMALFADNGFAIQELGLAAAWITSLSYTFQIYFDFSGYSDMAIGLGKMFNIAIPANFDQPYRSESITEFWRKWHITLGRALSTFVYIPLGGNRRGMRRTCFNLLITFFVSGLWHGAAWTFVLWGIFHGLFVVLERLFDKYLSKIPGAVKKITTFFIVNGLWVLFRAESFGDAINVYKGMINFSDINLLQLQELAFDSLVNFPGFIDVIYILAVVIVVFVLVFFLNSSNCLYDKFVFNKRTALSTSTCILLTLICVSKGSVFIYFNF
ncbi:MAG: MBOAT family protein [Dorea sp.]|nr:MBOAT family protein [Dorea sp.]